MKLMHWILSGAVALASFTAAADGGKPIRVIVPYAAGGLIDAMTRILASRMAGILEAPMIIENKPGANANIGATLAARAPADGHTLLASSSFLTTNPLIEQNLSWSTQQLLPVARFALSPNLVVVPRSSPYATLQDLLAAARGGRRISVLEAGAGAPQTMVKDILADSASVQFLAVQYAQGGTSYIADLVSGTLDMGVIPMNVGLGLVKSERIRALAITSADRSAQLPDTPTMAESGVPDAGINSWVGFHAPAGTPAEVVRRIEDAVREAAADDSVKSKLAVTGAQDAYQDTNAFKSFLKEDLQRAERFAKLRKAAAVSPAPQ